MRKRKLIAVMALLMMVSACAVKHQSAQYNAAVGLNDLSVAMQGLQNLEIGFHQSGIVPDANHQQIQKIFLQAAEVGKQANSAVRAGDFASAKGYFQAVIGLLNGLTPDMVGIKNPDSQKAFATAVQVAIGIAQEWVNNLGGAK